MLKKLITNLQQTPITFQNYFLTLVVIIVIRSQLEFIIEYPQAVTLNSEFYFVVVDYFHFLFSWLLIYLNILLWVNLFVKESFIATAKASLFLFPIIITPPLLDLFLGTPMQISYQMDFSNILFNLMHTFNFFETTVSFPYGVRIEVLLILIFSTLYVYIQTRAFWRSLVLGTILYLTIFAYAYLPAFFYALFPNFQEQSLLPFAFETNFLFYMYVPIMILLFIWLFSRFDTTLRLTLKQSFRIERLTIYIGIFLIGVITAFIAKYSLASLLNLYDLLKLLTGLFAITFAFMYATILNDIYDLEIDKVSNKNRPLVKQHISLNNFHGIKNTLFFLSLMFAMSVNFHFFFLTFFLLALSFIYSAPPLRLRRFFLLSHANLALIATFTYLLGTSLVYANKAITLLDHKLFMVVFILFFIASHLKDSKDTTGDQVENIRTLPILIGKKESYLLLSSVITLSLFFIGYFLDIGLLWTLLAVLVFVFASILFKNAEKLILGLQGSVGLLAFGYILS